MTPKPRKFKISFRPSEDWNYVEEYAKRHGLKSQEIIRVAVAWWLKKK